MIVRVRHIEVAIASATLLLALPVGASGAGDSSPVSDEPHTISAAFVHPSYAAGQIARLRIYTGPRRITLQLCRVGTTPLRRRRNDVLDGVPVMKPRYVHPGQVQLAMPAAASDLYVVRLSAPGGWLGYAPVIVHPRRLGTNRIAVVLPTNTWQAYNFRDDNHDGIGDTWYASASIHQVDLSRPFLDRGVPPSFRGYDRGFLRWLAHSGNSADVISDDDLERFASGDQLARLYDLIVFPGHEEYVTSHVFEIVSRYRDLGGNLMFLSANNFFYRLNGTAALWSAAGATATSAAQRRR